MALFYRCLGPSTVRWGAALLLCAFFPLAGAPPTSLAGSTPANRWAHFDLSDAGTTGELAIGKALSLTITLGGVTQGSVPVIALFESVLFESQMVTLEPDEDGPSLTGTVTLEPRPKSRTTVHPKAARIQVTFARLRQDKFERFMRRIVYVTLDRQRQGDDSSEATKPEEPATGDALEEEQQPDALPMSTGALVEEDLMPLADPEHGKAYWQQVSHALSRSWGRQVRGIKRGPSSETVRVHFRLFPSGRAQLIEIEKGSGVREIDEAGIYAIVNAQPFPPFPDDLGEEPVDVHVRMRTGAKSKPRDVQSATNQSASKPDAPGQAPKK